jgi:enolase
MTPTLQSLRALEILDSRGRPTVQTTCMLSDGTRATASVPSGASTGKAEALELRDGDPRRYRGLGCRTAVHNVNTTLNDVLKGRAFATQAELDEAMLALDGTPNKAKLGANAILSVSIAFARACAAQQNVPLYRHFAAMAGVAQPALPRLTINLFSGGKHAGGQAPMQDILLVPLAGTIDESLAMTFAVYSAAADLILQKYNMRTLRADEGGLAPPFAYPEAMLEDAVAAIEAAGLRPGVDVSLAVDVASSHFYHDGVYQLGNARLDSAGMIAQIAEWAARYPIISVEDGLSEDDWAHWPALRSALVQSVSRVAAPPPAPPQRGGEIAARGGEIAARGGEIAAPLTLGDDFLCTNPQRIQRAIDTQAADALLLKVNQIGTLSEAMQALTLAKGAGWKVVVSARSGETEDHWLADLATGWAGDFIKIGSITQSERLAKYNRLLAIEEETRFWW